MYLKYDHPELVEQVFRDVAAGDIENLRFYLMDGADPDMRNAEGSTLLHVATREARADCAQMLLDFGADPSLKDAKGRDARDIVEDKTRAAAEAIAATERQRKERLENDMADLRAKRPLKRLGPSR